MAKKAPAKPPAKRKPRPKKPVVPAAVVPSNPIAWRPWVLGGLKGVALVGVGLVAGVWFSGGIPIGPDGSSFSDCLSQSHTADRASQVRILREYAGKTFTSEPDAQSWLNAQRIEARKTDWIPYTDEIGAAADQGSEAVKALADKLEGK